MAPLDLAWAYTSAHAASFASRYPKTLAASVSLGLAGFAATAFGVAPMVPDAASLPQRIVTETRGDRRPAAQIEALAEHDLDLFRSDITRASDTADSLLARLGVNDTAAATFLRTDPVARKLLDGRAGKRVQVRVDASGQLEELVARYAAPGNDKLPTHFTRLRVERVAGQLVAYCDAGAAGGAAADGQRHGPHHRCSTRPTTPASRMRSRPRSPRSSPPTSTSVAS